MLLSLIYVAKKKFMQFLNTLRSATVSLSAIAAGLLISVPAQANPAGTLLADNHMSETMMESEPAADDTMNSQQSTEGMTIASIAVQNDSFQTLEQALQAAELVNTLSGEGPYTVFAPTDEAFNQLPDGALEYLLQPENRDVLKQVLTYHVVPGEVTASEITPGGLSALSGGLAIGVEGSRVIVNNASVVNANVQASNGVIHAINRVLIPEALRQQLAAQLGVEDIY